MGAHLHVASVRSHVPKGKEQLDGHDRAEQSAPVQPGRQAHEPRTHEPCTHGVGQPMEQSSPEKPRKQLQTPGETHVPWPAHSRGAVR